jgi:hypothetical protein
VQKAKSLHPIRVSDLPGFGLHSRERLNRVAPFHLVTGVGYSLGDVKEVPFPIVTVFAAPPSPTLGRDRELREEKLGANIDPK